MTRLAALALLVALVAPATFAQTRAASHDVSGVAAQAEAAGLDAPEARSLAGAVEASLAKGTADQTEDEILRASNAAENDQFGWSVSLSGDRALIGAYNESSSGAAYVYDFDGTSWTETAILRASNAEAFDVFGGSVSLSGDRALIGAYNESSSGAAYVYDFDGTSWTETAILRASNAEASDVFGFSVSLSGDRALVGAWRESGPSNSTLWSGAAYIFDLSGGVWTETALLRASNTEADDYFGESVSLSGDRALVGAFREDGPGNSLNASGAAYVFEVASGVWTETALLRASNAGARDRFGSSVSLWGDRALVGAVGEAGPGNGLNASGAAYVFEVASGVWTETALLRASNAGAGDIFGHSVSLSGDRALVGARNEDGPTNGTSSSGAAYVFDLSGGAWAETALLRASNAEADDRFGHSVSLSGDRALVGVEDEDGLTNGASASGAAYAFDFAEGPPEPTVPDVDIAYISSTRPPQRGEFVFVRARATNNETTTVQTRVYFDVLYPDNSDHTYSVLSKPFPGETTVQIQKIKKIKFRLPANAPAGEYLVTLFAADDLSNGGTIYDMDSFTFTLPPIDFVAPEASGALLSADGTVPLASGPNPFTDRTTIRYELASAADVELRVFDVQGREVAALALGVQEAGVHGAVLRAGSLPSGVYLWRLTADGTVTTGRVTLVR